MTAASEMAADECGAPAADPMSFLAAVERHRHAGLCRLRAGNPCSSGGARRQDRPRRAATGSSGTQAGLIAGFDGMRSGVRVLGITVGRPRTTRKERRSLSTRRGRISH